jgi:hypothetical protein
MNKKRLFWKQFGMVAVLMCSSGVWAAFTDSFESGLSNWTATGQVQVVTDELARNSGLSGFWLPTDGSYFASLWSTDSDQFQKAQLSRSFDGVAGETLSFDYFFDLNDNDAGGPEAPVSNSDWAKAELSGITLFEVYNLTGGWQTLSYVLPETKTYQLIFGANDMDGTFESVLGVDRVSVAGQVAVVPVPGAMLLGLIGVTTVGWLKRKVSL